MHMRTFYALSVLAMGLSSGAMADEGQVVSEVPLLEMPTQQEQMAATLYAATAQQYLSQADIVHYMETSQARCGNCADDDQEALLNYSRRFASAQSQWRDQGSVGVMLRSGETSFGLWGDVREVNIVENEEVSLLPSGLSTSVNTVPAAVNSSPGVGVNDSFGADTVADSPSPVSATNRLNVDGGNVDTSFSPAPAPAPVSATNRLSVNNGNADASFSRAPAPASARAPAPAPAATIAPVASANLTPSGGNVSPSTGATSVGPGRIQNFNTTTSDLAYKEYMGGLFVSQSF